MSNSICYLPEEVQSKIRTLWGKGTPDITGAAVIAVRHVDKIFEENMVPVDAGRQARLAVTAGRLAEQMRGKGSDAFMAEFERCCMGNISVTAAYDSLK